MDRMFKWIVECIVRVICWDSIDKELFSWTKFFWGLLFVFLSEPFASLYGTRFLYDETQENHVSILVYDAASLGTYADVVEYQVEFSGSTLKPIIQIEQASIWLRKAIAESIIKIK